MSSTASLLGRGAIPAAYQCHRTNGLAVEWVAPSAMLLSLLPGRINGVDGWPSSPWTLWPER